jgi:hypothetical protein
LYARVSGSLHWYNAPQFINLEIKVPGKVDFHTVLCQNGPTAIRLQNGHFQNCPYEIRRAQKIFNPEIEGINPVNHIFIVMTFSGKDKLQLVAALPVPEYTRKFPVEVFQVFQEKFFA